MSGFAWTTNVDEAKAEQLTLRSLIATERSEGAPASFERGLAIGSAYDETTKQAVAVALAFDSAGRYDREPIAGNAEVDFPYIPGLLAFRVGPAICKVLDQVEDDFDLLLFDGQGIAHPRGIGLASHIGVLYDKMSIGVTRNNLFGRVLDPPHTKGIASVIVDPKSNEVLGHSIILGETCPPIYVSPGHRVNPSEAIAILRRISRGDACFPTCLARAHGMANAAGRKLWRKRV